MKRRMITDDPVTSSLYNQKIFKAATITALFVISGLTAGMVIWMNQPMISTSYYHFNIQYRAGDEQSYNDIVENTFQHIVWMYGNHTNWNYTIECQFLLLEFVHDNYPHIFDAIKTQNLAGQLELIIPQYSSAFQVPYPLKSFADSVNYTKYRMEEYGLIQSRLILLQEGQWLPGFGQVLSANNFAGAIVSREQLAYFNCFPSQPVLEYNFKGRNTYAYVIPWIPLFEAGVYHHQIYTQDGEKINTGDVSTGDQSDFQFRPDKQANLEARHIELEKKGNKFMRLDDFFFYCINNGYTSTLDKFIPETEWVAAQYRTFFTWMGDGGSETDDGQLLARIYYARNLAQAAEVLLNVSFAEGYISPAQYAEWGMNRIGTTDGRLLNASKLIWEAQVTDTTGINPRNCEFWYGMNKTKDSIDITRAVIEDIRNAAGLGVWDDIIQINPYLMSVFNETSDFNNVTIIDDGFSIADLEEEFGFDLTVSQRAVFNTPTLNYTQTIQLCNFSSSLGNQTYYRLNLKFYGRFNITLKHDEAHWINNTSPGTGLMSDLDWYNTTGNPGANEISIRFADTWQTVTYSPALLENDTVELERDDYFYKPYGSENEWWVLLAGCNGMVYNPVGGYGIVKNNTVRHLAANWRSDSIEYLETNVKYNSEHEYYIVPGTLNEVLQFANQINSYGYLEFGVLV
jgi:hypothetical protein